MAATRKALSYSTGPVLHAPMGQDDKHIEIEFGILAFLIGAGLLNAVVRAVLALF